MSTKIAVHNLLEAKVLIKEAFAIGDEQKYHNAQWLTHSGKYIGKSFIRDTEFELVVEDTDSLDGYRSVTVEVL